MSLEFIDHVLGADWTSPIPVRRIPLDSTAFYGFPLRDNSGTRSADAVTDDNYSAHPAKRRRALTTEVSVGGAGSHSRPPLFSSRTPWPIVVHQPVRRTRSAPPLRAGGETRVRCPGVCRRVGPAPSFTGAQTRTHLPSPPPGVNPS